MMSGLFLVSGWKLSVLHVMSWVASLCFLSSIIWIVWSVGKKIMKPQSEITLPAREHGPVMIAERATIVLGKTLIVLLAVVGASDFLSVRPPMKDVLVVTLHRDGSYTMLSSEGQLFQTQFCHGRDNLEPGNKLKEIKFEQRVGCKDVRGRDLGYTVYVDEEGNRIKFPIPKEIAANER